jgi:hypothetical protein
MRLQMHVNRGLPAKARTGQVRLAGFFTRESGVSVDRKRSLDPLPGRNKKAAPGVAQDATWGGFNAASQIPFRPPL